MINTCWKIQLGQKECIIASNIVFYNMTDNHLIYLPLKTTTIFEKKDLSELFDLALLCVKSVQIRIVFSVPNTEKYGPEKTPYLETFHAVPKAPL